MYDARAAGRAGLSGHWNSMGLNCAAFGAAIESTGTRTGRRVVVAYHALGDTFPIGTLRGMIADAGWKDEDLRRLELVE
jgi:hypothetical protein